jgi:uncharacterized protein
MSINPDRRVSQVLDVNPQQLFDEGISTVVFDYDGVLAPYRKKMPVDVISWLEECIKIFGLSKIFILTNNPSLKRIKYFATTFPGITVIHGVKKKPAPEGLIKIIKQTGVSPVEVIMFDDQLLSGILAAKRAGIKSTLITKPYIGTDVRELWWIAKRLIEKFV